LLSHLANFGSSGRSDVPTTEFPGTLSGDLPPAVADTRAGTGGVAGAVTDAIEIDDPAAPAMDFAALYRDWERAVATLAAIGDGVVRTDAHGRVDFLNPAAEELIGGADEEALGRPVMELFRLVDEASREPLPDPVTACLEEGRVVSTPEHALLLGAAGGERAVRGSATPIYDAAGNALGAVLVFRDVTARRGMEREMIYLASHDALTGLLNRREFEVRLQRAILSARFDGGEHALLYLDLDEFKVVNDTCGHLIGDQLLRQVTALLRARVRRSDALARLGGDEFGVLLEDCPTARARQTAEEMRHTLRDFRFSFRGQVFEVGASIGLVPIGAGCGDLAEVMSAADAACYVAKDRGRNRVHEYEPDDTGLALRHGEMQWIQRIHNAFEERRFRLYFQAIKPLGGEPSSLAGGEPPPMCEILLRMLDREGKVIEPSAFVVAAERYHLIGSLDRWVVQTALAAVGEAQRGGAATLFTVNLSGQSLSDESFLAFVVEQLAASGVDPRRICFEITETAAMSKLDSALRFLSTLRDQGCRFALDDFGSGLSSFAYLRNLPVDFLKIDGALVQDMAQDPVKRAMVEAINRIGHVMGMRTIAEWVESREVLDVLTALGVDYGQGFWLCRAEPLIHDR
jgi:diguanylate cyclase (GGDEF)-like protein/PAS domain S-box-containing protein